MTPEAELKTAIKKYLRLTGWFIFHVQQGMYSYPGIADMVAIKDGITIWIETKVHPRKQSPGQIKFQNDVEQAGGIYILAYSIDDLIEKVQVLTEEKISLFA